MQLFETVKVYMQGFETVKTLKNKEVLKMGVLINHIKFFLTKTKEGLSDYFHYVVTRMEVDL